MLIDKPTCSFKNCRKNFDHNCLAVGGERAGCEFRVMEEVYNGVCQALANETNSSKEEIMEIFETAVVKRFKG